VPHLDNEVVDANELAVGVVLQNHRNYGLPK
jgi:hypothetical protein